MSGKPEPEIRSNNPSHRFRREIILPHVHAIKFRGQAKVRAVIHDQLRHVWVGHSCPTQPAQLPSLLQYQARVPTLVTVLEEYAARGSEALRFRQ